MIIDYDILFAASRFAMVESVVEKIKQGWQPDGELCYAQGQEAEWFYQKIVKYDKSLPAPANDAG